MKYGKYLNRFLAFIIDSIIVSTIISIIWFVLDLPIFPYGVEKFKIGKIIFFQTPIAFIISVLYHGITESSSMQASLGKKMMGLKVCDIEGNKLTSLNSLVRNANKFISALLVMMGYIYIFISKKNQSLHDILSNAVVIKSKD